MSFLRSWACGNSLHHLRFTHINFLAYFYVSNDELLQHPLYFRRLFAMRTMSKLQIFRFPKSCGWTVKKWIRATTISRKMHVNGLPCCKVCNIIDVLRASCVGTEPSFQYHHVKADNIRMRGVITDEGRGKNVDSVGENRGGCLVYLSIHLSNQNLRQMSGMDRR